MHRPQLAAEILGIELGASLAIDHVLKLLLDARAGRKAAPPTARCWPALTATDTVAPDQLAAVRAALNTHPHVTGWIEATANRTYTAHRRGPQPR